MNPPEPESKPSGSDQKEDRDPEQDPELICGQAQGTAETRRFFDQHPPEATEDDDANHAGEEQQPVGSPHAEGDVSFQDPGGGYPHQCHGNEQSKADQEVGEIEPVIRGTEPTESEGGNQGREDETGGRGVGDQLHHLADGEGSDGPRPGLAHVRNPS